MSNITERYIAKFKELQLAGVPKWYIRQEILTDLPYWKTVYVYRNSNVYDAETDGWFTTNAIGITSEAGSTKYYGEVPNLGMPSLEAVRTLHDDESTFDILQDYDRLQEYWNEACDKANAATYD